MKITGTSITKTAFNLMLTAVCILAFISCSKDELNNIQQPPNISIKVVETVYLPNNSVDISATLSDSDGKIKKILWTKVKGGTADFKNDEASISISNLEKGDYQFKITVTDDDNLTSEKTVSFKVDDSRILHKIDFDTSNEDFKTSIRGDFPIGKALVNVNESTNHCGRSFRGKKEDFIDWKGYSYKGNDSFFLATNMGSCGGIFTSSFEKEITFSEDHNKEEIEIQFDYYMPGDFSKWGAYDLNVFIFPADKVFNTTPIARLDPKIDSKGWTRFKGKFNAKVLKGKYKLVIVQKGAQTAIDNINIYKTK